MMRYFLLLAWLISVQTAYAEKAYFGRVTQAFSNQIKQPCGEQIINGEISFILSFARSASIGAVHIKGNQQPADPEGDCQSSEIFELIHLSLEVNEENQSFTAHNTSQSIEISGNLSREQIIGQYQYNDTEKFFSGNFTMQIKPLPGELSQIKQLSGQILHASSLGVTTVTDNIRDAAVLVSDAESFAQWQDYLGADIRLNPKSILSSLPSKRIDNNDIRRFMLAKGKVNISHNLDTQNYTIITPIGKIQAIANDPSNLLSLRTTNHTSNVNFSCEYQNDSYSQLSTLNVEVQSGELNIELNNGEIYRLGAGEQASYQQTIQRSAWVLPTDGGIVYNRVENILAWTQHPDAVAYQLEYNFPEPIFSEENNSVLEYPSTSFIVDESLYEIIEDVIVMPLFIEGLTVDTQVEVRIFALDKELNIIANSQSSDRVTLNIN